ncbi:hypothetical protein H5V45_18400 [Nocardioides sp. KIGAM211]|uniref:Aminoglycoside phosphotransferase domain-containing protein n=1 Tax=Nocardioides luti TaxID=2761101 RepID=A0A7X0RJ59_9ACTN|nr:hypothetical protein [Nocardioides luti]MBB6629304.1 hypothetical protein [Nocardioides luti]
MSAPRAVGVRAPYAAVPARVRAWVDEALGSPVVRASEQVGGMSPGCATRLTCADGSRAFVKAVGTDLNPDTPGLFRREVDALSLLGEHPSWAGLLTSYDDGDWVALLLEDVEGTHPDLADDAVMDALLHATDDLGRVMRERLPTAPAVPAVADPSVPPLYRPGPVDLGEVLGGWLDAVDRVGDVPADLLPSWVGAHRDDLRAGLLDLLEQPRDRAVHWDIRNDNLLQRPSGELVFLDWGAFGVGPDWLDPLLARLERVDRPWFDASLAASPALARAGDELVTSWLVGVGVHLAWRAHTAVDLNLPSLRAFRRTESARFLGAAARRLGHDPS